MSRPLEAASAALDIELHTPEFYEDQTMAIETSVLSELEADRDSGFITAEDCNALYSGWVKKYRGVHPRPDFKV